MIFTVILICVLGRDFGCMLFAERAAQTSSSQTQTDIKPTKIDTSGGGLESSVLSLNDDEKKSSVVLSERSRGESCSLKKRRNDTATSSNNKLQGYTNTMADEDHGESIFTGTLLYIYNPRCACEAGLR